MDWMETMFGVNEQKIKDLYHRAWLEANRGNVDPHKYPYLDRALLQFARENDCSYSDAFILAKTGKRLGRLQK